MKSLIEKKAFEILNRTPIMGTDYNDTERQLEDSGFFLEVLKIAEGYGLQSEYVVFYTRAIERGMNIVDAVNYARSEWDF